MTAKKLNMYQKSGGMQAVHNNTMTIFSSIDQHCFIQSTKGNIRWTTFDVALNQYKKFQLTQLN